MTDTLMYDAVTPANIPKDTAAVLVYIDGRYKWTAADLALFPGIPHLLIATDPTTDDGRVIDVENGDADPAQAVSWVEMRRRSTAHPLGGPAMVYTSLSNWDTVLQYFVDARTPQPDWFIASWDDDPAIMSGAVAKQFRNTPGWDLSAVRPGIV